MDYFSYFNVYLFSLEKKVEKLIFDIDVY